MTKVGFRCVVHDVDVTIAWRQERPEGLAHECPLCAAERVAKVVKELALIRSHRDGLLQMVDLAKNIQDIA